MGGVLRELVGELAAIAVDTGSEMIDAWSWWPVILGTVVVGGLAGWDVWGQIAAWWRRRRP